MPVSPAPDEFFLDPRRVRRSFDAAAASFDSAAAVHSEIRTRLLERLDVVRLDPGVVVDLGAATGHASRALKARYPGAQVVAVDLSVPMLIEARRQQRLFRRFSRLAADAHRLPLRDASADLIFSNLMLQWCGDPDSVLGESRRALKSNGLLTFTSLGPDTLRELRSAWSGIDTFIHVHRFIDMHDLGDALLRAGFAEPVMDTERLTITYPDTNSLIRELALSGSGNVAYGRRRGLTGVESGKRFRDACEAQRRNGTLPVTLEVVYGHAWAGEKGRKLSGAPGETVIPVRSIGRRR